MKQLTLEQFSKQHFNDRFDVFQATSSFGEVACKKQIPGYDILLANFYPTVKALINCNSRACN